MSDVSGNNATEKAPKKSKKINGLLIVGLILFVWIIASYRPDVPSPPCDDEILADKPEVIMFGTWWCPYCYQARRYLHNNNIKYCEYDIEKSDVGKRRYDEIKASAIPAFIIGKYMLQGFSENNIDEALMMSRKNK